MRRPVQTRRESLSKELLASLGADEPDYPELARRLPPAAIRDLEQLSEDKDLLLASKAIFLASLVDEPAFSLLAEKTQKRRDASLRVAVAGAARNLEPKRAARILSPMLSDRDAGVRKTALLSITKAARPYLQKEIRNLLETETSDYIRELATERLE